MTKTFNLCGYQVSFKSQAQSSHQQHSNDAPPHSRTNPPVGNQPGLLPSWQGPSPQAPCLQVRYHLHLIIIIGTSFSGEISPVLLTPYPIQPQPSLSKEECLLDKQCQFFWSNFQYRGLNFWECLYLCCCFFCHPF